MTHQIVFGTIPEIEARDRSIEAQKRLNEYLIEHNFKSVDDFAKDILDRRKENDPLLALAINKMEH